MSCDWWRAGHLTSDWCRWAEVGRAMFPTFAFMSHSCNYNARHVIAGDTMQVFAQKRILAGEEVTITYTSLLTHFAHKQEKLATTWYFNCACERSGPAVTSGSCSL